MKEQGDSGFVHPAATGGQVASPLTDSAPRALKRTVPQSVFDGAYALRIAKQAVRESIAELAAIPRAMLDEGNPNHPRYDLHLFGEPAEQFMARQYRA